jgi:hypothetical protein
VTIEVRKLHQSWVRLRSSHRIRPKEHTTWVRIPAGNKEARNAVMNLKLHWTWIVNAIEIKKIEKWKCFLCQNNSLFSESVMNQHIAKCAFSPLGTYPGFNAPSFLKKNICKMPIFILRPILDMTFVPNFPNFFKIDPFKCFSLMKLNEIVPN